MQTLNMKIKRSSASKNVSSRIYADAYSVKQEKV